MNYLEVKGKDSYEREANLAKGLKRLSNKYRIPVIGTVEIRKQTEQHFVTPGRPSKRRLLTNSDVAGNRQLTFHADFILLIQPENIAEFDDPGRSIGEIHGYISKNKLSIGKGKYPLRFKKFIAKMSEETDDSEMPPYDGKSAASGDDNEDPF